MKTPAPLTPQQKLQAQKLLDSAAELQHKLWHAIRALEQCLNIEIDADRKELRAETVDSLIEERNSGL